MKKALLCIVVVALALLISPGGQSKKEIFSIGLPCVEAKSGCCSHHGGVCGCVGDNIQCCDGTLSPSCTCSGY